MTRVVFLGSAVVTLFLLVASPALATRPDDRVGARGPGAVAVTTTVLRPDDRGGIRGAGAAESDEPVLASASGFDWTAAGVGLMGGVALAVVAGGLAATTVLRHRGQRLA